MSKQTHRALCLRALSLFDMLKHGPQDALVNEWLADLMDTDHEAYKAKPTDAYDGTFPVRSSGDST